MARVPGSLREEAARRGVSLYQVRLERGTAAGYGRRQSVGHPRKGELRISVDKAIQAIKDTTKTKAQKIKAGQALNRFQQRGETRHELWTRMVFSPPLRNLGLQYGEDLNEEEAEPLDAQDPATRKLIIEEAARADWDLVSMGKLQGLPGYKGTWGKSVKRGHHQRRAGGEWDWASDINPAERARLGRRWTSPTGLEPDVMAAEVASRLGGDPGDIEGQLMKWLHLTRQADAGRLLKRGRHEIPEASYGHETWSSLFAVDELEDTEAEWLWREQHARRQEFRPVSYIENGRVVHVRSAVELEDF